MKKILIAVTFIIALSSLSIAQVPRRGDFGFGIKLGDPTGATLKFWTNRENAFVVDVGASYFGSPRIGVDYLWHFNAFNSNIVDLYAGMGGVIGIGRGKGFWFKDKFGRPDNDIGLGVRGVFGVDVVPMNTPLEILFEIGALIGFVPDFGSAADVAIGIRFYP